MMKRRAANPWASRWPWKASAIAPAIADEGGHRGTPAALAVAAELGHEQVDADAAVERRQGVVVRGDLPIAVEVENRRLCRAGGVKAGRDVHAGSDLDHLIARASRRRAGVGSRIEHRRRGAGTVD